MKKSRKRNLILSIITSPLLLAVLTIILTSLYIDRADSQTRYFRERPPPDTIKPPPITPPHLGTITYLYINDDMVGEFHGLIYDIGNNSIRIKAKLNPVTKPL